MRPVRQRSKQTGLVRLGAALLACLMHPGAGAQLRWDQPPGVMVNLGTHRLHLYCLGTNEPTAIIDVGLGATSLEWLRVLDSAQVHQRTCVYDRAGYAWSDPGPQPRTSVRIANELATLLERSATPGPYVLVGHSFGGLNMQMFAKLYPQRVAGLVLVDASHPQQAERFSLPPLNLNTAPATRNGLPVFSDRQAPVQLPQALRDLTMLFMLMPKSKNVIGDEYVNMRQSAAQVATEPFPPQLPLLVLTRGRHGAPATPQAVQIETVWLGLQTELAGQSAYAAHLLASNSGHHIHLDQPRLVADAIALIVDVARQQMPRTSAPREPHWLTFEGALWLSDTLPDRLTRDPSRRGRLAQNSNSLLGRSAASPLALPR
jgi:pimeloyl-ACP methyl ester carboxylesterase